MNSKTERPCGEDLFFNGYSHILNFASQNNNITYERFDACTANEVNLFAMREDFDFERLNLSLNRIIQDLPSIKRVFAKPIIRLKDNGDILPIESVRVVNSRTIEHAARHSELWESVGEDGVKPKKLFTLMLDDEYAIYENLVFVRTINIILAYVSKNIRLLTEMLYTDRELRFNILERLNHIEYFLAIGKLHMGYVKDYDKYRPAAERCIEKLLFVDHVIRARLKSPLYKQCKKYDAPLTLKKTNVFRMHKDYYRVYLLLKWLSDSKITEAEDAVAVSNEYKAGYVLYCSMITLFAAGHFNFTFSRDSKIDFYHMDQDASFLDWKLNIKTLVCANTVAIGLTLKKDIEYKVMILPSADSEEAKKELLEVKKIITADEYIVAGEFDGGDASVFISLFDIDSFRRIQQILLRAMIKSDKERRICPFCGNHLSCAADEDTAICECHSCRTVINDIKCENCGREYTVTSIKNYCPDVSVPYTGPYRDNIMHDRYAEAAMHFRNITPITDNLRAVCPECKKVHNTSHRIF